MKAKHLFKRSALLCGSLLTWATLATGFRAFADNTPPVFTGGAAQTISICQGSTAVDIDMLLTANDPDAGQTETWSIVAGPANGTLNGFDYMATSNGTDNTPAGLTYTPAPGFTGADVFTIQVSDGVDVTTTTISVTVNPAPDAGSINGPATLCAGTVATFTDAATDGTWSSNDPAVATIDMTSGEATALSAGTTAITYTVTNSCGSAVTVATLVVNAIPALTSNTSPSAICGSTAFNYTPASNIPGATFAWSRAFNGGISNPVTSGTGSISETLNNITNYDVTVTYTYIVTANGCTSTPQNVNVTIHPIPRLSSSLFDTICSGSTFNYTPAPTIAGTTYTWSRSEVTGISPATASGDGAISETLTSGSSDAVSTVYTFMLAANGCTSTRNLTVTIFPAITNAAITTAVPPIVCAGTMYQGFGASETPLAGSAYTWSAINATVYAVGEGGQNSLINFDTPGDALVILTSGNSNCSTHDTVMVNVTATPQTTAGILYTADQFVYLDNTAQGYQWGYDDVHTLAGTIVPDQTFQSYPNPTPDFTDNYYWVMVTEGGCTQKVYYNAPNAVASIPGNTPGITIYPNPAGDMVSITVNNTISKTNTIIITDMLGKVVMTGSVSHTQQLDIAALPAGNYIVGCYSNGQKIAAAKLIKH